MLSLVPLVYAFLMDNVFTSPHGAALNEHVRCFGLLTSIVALLQRVETAVSNVDHLQELIDEYCPLFMDLYDRAIPKFHHMFHLHESLLKFHRCLSCFVTERRHRTTKKAAVHAFRYLEQTVLKDCINRMCSMFGSSQSLFREKFLVSPKVADIHGGQVLSSEKAVLHCGMLRRGDIVYAKVVDQVFVGRLTRFYEHNGTIIVHVDTFRKTYPNDERFWNHRRPETVFLESCSIVDAMPWRVHDEGVYRVVPPFVVNR